jgi:hypothetical protein
VEIFWNACGCVCDSRARCARVGSKKAAREARGRGCGGRSPPRNGSAHLPLKAASTVSVPLKAASTGQAANAGSSNSPALAACPVEAAFKGTLTVEAAFKGTVTP